MSDIVYLVLAAVAVSFFGYACHALAKHLAEKNASSRGARIVNVIGDVADHIGAALKAAPQISGNPAIISAAVQAGVGQVSARIPEVLAKAGVHDSVIQTTLATTLATKLNSEVAGALSKVTNGPAATAEPPAEVAHLAAAATTLGSVITASATAAGNSAFRAVL